MLVRVRSAAVAAALEALGFVPVGFDHAKIRCSFFHCTDRQCCEPCSHCVRHLSGKVRTRTILRPPAGMPRRLVRHRVSRLMTLTRATDHIGDSRVDLDDPMRIRSCGVCP